MYPHMRRLTILTSMVVNDAIEWSVDAMRSLHHKETEVRCKILLEVIDNYK